MDFRNDWLVKLGKELNIPDLAFDGDGFCQLNVDDKWKVFVYKPSEKENLLLLAHLPVMHLPVHALQQILIENRHHRQHNAPVLSLSENLDVIEIHFKLTQPELEATENIMEQLLDNLDYWHGRLNNA
jgi:hypothetical protein